MLDGIVAAPEQRSPSFPQSAIAPILSRPASELFPLRLRALPAQSFLPHARPQLVDDLQRTHPCCSPGLVLLNRRRVYGRAL
jgi:hypothetical protein